MSAIDWVLLAVVTLSAVFGLLRGFIGVLASLAAWALATWAAFRYGGAVALMLSSDGSPGPGQVFGGYALAFIAVLLAVGVVGWLVRKLVHTVGLSGIDRFFGLLLGLLRGVFVGCVLVLMLGLTALPRDADWQRSQVLPVFVPGALWLRAWLPQWVAEQVDLDGRPPAPADDAPVLPAPVTAAETAGQDAPDIHDPHPMPSGDTNPGQ